MEFTTFMEIMSRNIKIPAPDTEATRLAWDEESQSVKQEIIPLKDMHDPYYAGDIGNPGTAEKHLQPANNAVPQSGDKEG